MLRLKFNNGSTRVYENHSKGCDRGNNEYECVAYELTGYFPNSGLLLVEISYYEGVEWRLVGIATGTESNILSPPHYSPQKKWLASVNWSDGPSGGGNGLDIVPAMPNDAVREFHYRVPNGEYAAYEFVGWDGDDHLKLTITFNAGQDTKTLPASVDLINGVWRLKLPEEYRRAAHP